jgi:hypothetical protein
LYPERITWVKAWRYADFKEYFLNASPERQMQFRKAMNVSEMEIIHDPTIKDEVPKPQPGPQTIKKVGKPTGGARR